jgi:hypothetical protein
MRIAQRQTLTLGSYRRLGAGAPLPNGTVTVAAQTSAYFDGETGRYTLPRTAQWTLPNSNWYVAFWMKVDYQQSGARYILDNASSGNGMFRIYTETGRPWANFQIAGSNKLMNSTGSIVSGANAGLWRLVVLQRDGSNYVIKGCPQGSSTVTTFFTLAHTDTASQNLAGTTLHVGSRFDQNASAFFQQYIGWFAKGDGVALSDAQIISLAAGTELSTLGVDIKAYYKVNGDATLTDLSGNNNTATRVGGVYPRGVLAFSGQPFTINGNDNTVRGFVYQRAAGTTSKTITFTGTYNGAPGGIEARICSGQGTQVIPWARCISPSVGNWSVNFVNVPQGSNYYLEVRDTANTANIARSIWHFGVGIVYFWIGQSNATLMTSGNSSALYTINQDLFFRASVRAFAGTYQELRTTGSTVIPVADNVSAQQGCPVMVVDAATGGSGLFTGWDTRSSAFYQSFLTRLAAVGGDCEGFAWFQGEADGGSTSAANAYLTSFGTMLTNLRTDVGRSAANLPMYLAILGRKGSAASPDEWRTVRSAQMNAETNYTNVKLVGGYYDLPYTDDLHMTAASYVKMARRVSQAMLNYFAPGTYPTGMKGPEPTSASIIGNDIIMSFTMNNGTNLRGNTSNTGITGFEVRDGSNVVQTINAAAITSANQITLTMASTPAAGWTVRYIPAATFDNSNLAYSDAPVIGIATNDTVPAMPTRIPITL